MYKALDLTIGLPGELKTIVFLQINVGLSVFGGLLEGMGSTFHAEV